MSRKLVILGSTGSIGQSALDVVAALGDDVEIVGLAAGARWEVLAHQAQRWRVPVVALAEEAHVDDLRRAVPKGTRLLAGADGLVTLVQETGADFVLSAIVGAAGLPATLAAVERGLDVGLANKESLVVAGELLMPLAQRTGATVLPVDSEHSALFQSLQAGQPREIRKLYLTASGGPFRTWSAAEIERATLQDALNHPTWDMGPKITIDSATMMNKALEIIEAHHLFGVAPEQIDVLIHPQSIVHSMVEFCDGSVIAQMGVPDMRTPIQYAITYPHRRGGVAAFVDWHRVGSLDFTAPDHDRFPALELGMRAARAGGTSGAVLNAANEAAVAQFRGGNLRFVDLTAVTAEVLGRHEPITQPTLEQLLAADAWARQEVLGCLQA